MMMMKVQNNAALQGSVNSLTYLTSIDPATAVFFSFVLALMLVPALALVFELKFEKTLKISKPEELQL